MTRAVMPSSASRSVAASASCTVTPAATRGTWSPGGGAQDAAAADLEALARLVDHRGGAAARAQVADAAQVRQRARQPGGLVGVARAEHGAAVHGAQRCQVLQAHLGRAVRADPGTRVRADE